MNVSYEYKNLKSFAIKSTATNLGDSTLLKQLFKNENQKIIHVLKVFGHRVAFEIALFIYNLKTKD